jgi:glucose/mannose-6-phosphate isomerase
MGGSGIGGLIAKGLLEEKASVPIFVSQDYSLPKFADRDWLAIIVSYSGNTEETLSAFREAKKRKMGIVCVSSGGILSEECENCISIPGGFAPRTQLGMTFAPVIAVLEKLGIVQAGSELEKTAVFLERAQEKAEAEGKKIAKALYKKIPAIYSTRKFGSAALRFHTQLAENSKVFSHWNVLPELNHNEIVGFLPCEEKLSFVFFRDKGETGQERRRMEFTKKIVSRKSQCIEVWAEGDTGMEKTFYFILAGDFASYYLALLNRVDPAEVENIERLKKELKK